MNTLLGAVSIALLGALAFGGPLDQFSYHTQSIVFGIGLGIYLLVRHPSARLRNATPAPWRSDGDPMASLWADVQHLIGGDEDADQVPLPQPATSAARPPRRPATPQTSTDPYVGEATVINNQLKYVYGIEAQINPRDIVKSWTYITYPLTPTGHTPYDKTMKITGDLARDISLLYRSKHGNTDHVSVQAVDAHPKTLLQVTRAVPKPLLWSERPRGLGAMTTAIGFYADGLAQKPMLIEMAGQDSNHINGGFYGQPGAGKSSTLLTALDILLANTPPSMLEVYGIDLKVNTFKRYAGVPHMRQYTSNANAAINILDHFVQWCHEETANPDLKYRLLVIDEFQLLLNHPEVGKAALEKITKIMTAGREWGIRVWTATQNPNADNYPAVLKPLTHFMACGKIQNDNYVRSQLGIYGASIIMPRREMVWTDGSMTNYRVATFWYSAEDRSESLQSLLQGANRSANRREAGREPQREQARELPREEWIEEKREPDGEEREEPREENTEGANRVQREPDARREDAMLMLDPALVRFPLASHRPPTQVEVLAIQRLHARENFTLTELCIRVYGSKNTQTLSLIKKAVPYHPGIKQGAA